MNVYKDLLGEEIRYNLGDINKIIEKLRYEKMEGIKGDQTCKNMILKYEEEFLESEEWNKKIKENFECSWKELKEILWTNFAVYFYRGYFYKRFTVDNLGFIDEHTLIKGKVIERELNFKDKLKFNEKKTTYDKNISFRISEEAYNNLKEMLLNTNQNNGEFFSNMIIEGYNKYFLEKEPEKIYIINNYKL